PVDPHPVAGQGARRLSHGARVYGRGHLDLSAMDHAARPRARALLLSGPSGSGKSRLARRLHARHGGPLVQLDDFYREGDAPDLPMSPLGLVDWDDVRSWDLHAAVDALERLCRTGRADVPLYDISTSS